MSTQTQNRPSAGYGDRQRTKSVWFTAKTGRFHYRQQNEDGKYEDQSCDFVHGRIAPIEIRWNEGNDAVAGHEEIVFTFLGENEAGETEQLKVVNHFPSTFARMILSRIDGINLGDHIGISIWGSKDNEKVSFGTLERAVGDQWVKVAVRDDIPKYDTEHEAQVTTGLKGAKLKDAKEDLRKEYNRALREWCVAVLKGKPTLYIPTEQTEETLEEAIYDPETGEKVQAASERPRNTNFGGSANAHESGQPVEGERLQALANEVFGGGETSAAGEDEVYKDVWELDKWEAFGMLSGNCPHEEDFKSLIDPVGRMMTTLEEICANRLEIRDGADCYITVRATLRALGAPEEWVAEIRENADMTEGDVKLTGKFLASGNVQQIKTAIARERLEIKRQKESESAAQANADEFDPFAD